MDEHTEESSEAAVLKPASATMSLCDDLDMSNGLSLDSSMLMQAEHLPLLTDGELVTASPEDISAVLSSIEQSDTGGETGAETETDDCVTHTEMDAKNENSNQHQTYCEGINKPTVFSSVDDSSENVSGEFAGDAPSSVIGAKLDSPSNTPGADTVMDDKDIIDQSDVCERGAVKDDTIAPTSNGDSTPSVEAEKQSHAVPDSDLASPNREGPGSCQAASVISDNISEKSFSESVRSDVSGLADEKLRKRERRKRRRDSQKFDVGKASFQPVVLLEDIMKSDLIQNLTISGWHRCGETSSERPSKKRQKCSSSKAKTSALNSEDDEHITYELGSDTLLVCNKSKQPDSLFQASFSSDEDDTRHLDNLNKALEAIIGGDKSASGESEEETENSNQSLFNVSPSKTKLVQKILTESDSESSFEGFSDTESLPKTMNSAKRSRCSEKSNNKERTGSRKKLKLDAKTLKNETKRSSKVASTVLKSKQDIRMPSSQPSLSSSSKSEQKSEESRHRSEMCEPSVELVSVIERDMKVDLSRVKIEKHDPGYEASERGCVKTSIADNIFETLSQANRQDNYTLPVSFANIKRELKYFQASPPPRLNLETLPKRFATCVKKIAKQYPNVLKECIVCLQKVTPRQISKILSLKHSRDDDEENAYGSFFSQQAAFIREVKQDRESIDASNERKHVVKSKEYVSDSESESDELAGDELAYQPVQIIEMGADDGMEDMVMDTDKTVVSEMSIVESVDKSDKSSSSSLSSDSDSDVNVERETKDDKTSLKKKTKKPSSDVAHFLQRRDEERSHKTKRKEMLERLRDAKLQAKKLSSHRSDSDDIDSGETKKENSKKADVHPLNANFGLQTFKIPKKVSAKDGSPAKPLTKAAVKSLPPIPKSEMSRREEFEYKYAGWRKTDKNDQIPRRFPMMGPKSRTIDNPQWRNNQSRVKRDEPDVKLSSADSVPAAVGNAAISKTERKPLAVVEKKRNVLIPDEASLGSSTSILDTLLPLSKPTPNTSRPMIGHDVKPSLGRDTVRKAHGPSGNETKVKAAPGDERVRKSRWDHGNDVKPVPARDPLCKVSGDSGKKDPSNYDSARMPAVVTNVASRLSPAHDVVENKTTLSQDPILDYKHSASHNVTGGEAHPLAETSKRPLLERPKPLLERPKPLLPLPSPELLERSHTPPIRASPSHVPVFPPPAAIPASRFREESSTGVPADISPYADTPESDGDDYAAPVDGSLSSVGNRLTDLTPNFKADANRLEKLQALSQIVDESVTDLPASSNPHSITMAMEDFVNVLTIQKNLEKQIQELTQMKQNSTDKPEAEESGVKSETPGRTPQVSSQPGKSPAESEGSSKVKHRGDTTKDHRRHSKESSSSHRSSKHPSRGSSSKPDGKERHLSHHEVAKHSSKKPAHQEHKKRESSDKHRGHQREQSRSHKERDCDPSKRLPKSDDKKRHAKYADYLDSIEFAPSPTESDPDLELKLPSPGGSPQLGKKETKTSVIPAPLSNYGIQNTFTSFLGSGKSTTEIFSDTTTQADEEKAARVEEADSTVVDRFSVSTLEQKLLELKQEVEQVADDDEKMLILEQRMLSLRNELIQEESRSKSSSPLPRDEKPTRTAAPVADPSVSTTNDGAATPVSIAQSKAAPSGFMNSFASVDVVQPQAPIMNSLKRGTSLDISFPKSIPSLKTLPAPPTLPAVTKAPDFLTAPPPPVSTPPRVPPPPTSAPQPVPPPPTSAPPRIPPPPTSAPQPVPPPPSNTPQPVPPPPPSEPQLVPPPPPPPPTTTAMPPLVSGLSVPVPSTVIPTSAMSTPQPPASVVSVAKPLPVPPLPPLPFFTSPTFSSVTGPVKQQPWPAHSAVAGLFLPPPPPPPPPASEPAPPESEEPMDDVLPTTGAGHCSQFLTVGRCPDGAECALFHRIPTDWTEERIVVLLSSVISSGNLDEIMDVYLCIEQRTSKLTEALLLGLLNRQELIHSLFADEHTHKFGEVINDMCEFHLLTPSVVDTIILLSKDKGLVMQEKVWQLWQLSSSENFQLSSQSLDVLCEIFTASQTYQRLWSVVHHSNQNQGYIPSDAAIYTLLKMIASCNVQHILAMMSFFEQLPVVVMDRLNKNLIEATTPKIHFLRRAMMNCIVNTCSKKRWDMLGRLFIKLVLAATPIPQCYTELITKQHVASDCAGFRPFIQVLEDKFEELQKFGIKGEIARVGAAIIHVCKTEQHWSAGFDTLLVLKEFRIPFFKAHGVWDVPSAVLAMSAVEICLEAGKPIEAFDVLEGSKFCCRSVDESVELTGQRLFLIQRTMLQLVEQSMTKEAGVLFVDLMHNYEHEKQVVFDYDDVIDVPWFYNKLQLQALEGGHLECALSVYKCHSVTTVLRPDSQTRRCLLTACVRAGNMVKFSRELLTDAFRDGTYPQQSLFNEPRMIRVTSNMTQEEMYIVTNMYVTKLYDYLCDRRRNTGTQLTPRDTLLAVQVESGNAGNARSLSLLNVSNTLHDACLRVMEVLEMQMKPPIECMLASPGRVEVVPSSLYRHFQKRESMKDI